MAPVTESPPVTDPRELGARADETAAALQSLATTLTPDDQATVTLNLSRSALLDVMAAGDLDGVIVGGRVYAIPEQVHARVLDEARTGIARAMELRTQTHAVLRAFLADRPLVALYDEAVGEARPLVCARRGARFVNYGLRYHSVVLKVRWLTDYAMAPQVRERYPELASLPAGPQLYAAVLELPGVTPISFATPLAEQGEQQPRGHRLSAWVRVDPDVWDMRVPDLITRLVERPA